MSDLQQQVAELRARVARIQQSYESRSISHSLRNRFGKEKRRGEDCFGGEEVQTSHGCHVETEKLYERHRRHGSADIGALAELPEDLLHAISEGSISGASPEQWAFLDTETTGLAGGAGACAFLVGVGRITTEGFRVRQFFMRDHEEEASVLDALTRHLSQFQVLITYNGRVFDQPLLEARYRLNRSRPPFGRMEHLDLLYGARRLWKLRYESCRLVDLENRVLGFERQGDVPGALIPYIYFEYERTGQVSRLLPVFHHNAMDILTLACLTGIVPYAFQDPGSMPQRHGAEMAGIGRWVREGGDLERARALFQRAVDAGLPDELLFRTLWDIAAIDRKLGREESAVGMWTDLAAAKNPFRVRALEELAKHHEHRGKNLALALEATCAALEFGESAGLRRRHERLVRRAGFSRRGASAPHLEGPVKARRGLKAAHLSTAKASELL